MDTSAHDDGQGRLPSAGNGVSGLTPILPDREGDACRAFRKRHPKVAAAAHRNPLYALPTTLLDEIESEGGLAGWLSEDERAFERDLTGFCGVDRVGIVEDSRVSFSILAGPSRLSGPAGSPSPPIPAGIEAILQERLDPLNDQMAAYLGWMLTNPAFLGERALIREHRLARSSWHSFSFFPWEPDADPTFRAFLDRWILSEMRSWELPIPQGPNFSGVPWPDSVTSNKPAVQVEVPVTIGLRSAYPLRETMEEIRRRETPAHLTDWLDVLQRKGNRKGPHYFQQVFRLHFYRDLALGARYGERLKGRVESLDRVFGEFMGLGADRVKRLRLDVARRLGRSAP